MKTERHDPLKPSCLISTTSLVNAAAFFILYFFNVKRKKNVRSKTIQSQQNLLDLHWMDENNPVLFWKWVILTKSCLPLLQRKWLTPQNYWSQNYFLQNCSIFGKRRQWPHVILLIKHLNTFSSDVDLLTSSGHVETYGGELEEIIQRFLRPQQVQKYVTNLERWRSARNRFWLSSQLPADKQDLFAINKSEFKSSYAVSFLIWSTL